MSRAITVIDIGGTHMRWASWSPDTGLGGRQSSPTPSFRRHADLPVPQLQELLVDAICKATPRKKDAVVGMSFGAAINHLNGMVYASAPLWGAHDAPFDLMGALSRKRPDVEWHVVNDVTAALLHVASLPLCALDRKVMLITISTGIAARTIYRETLRIPFDPCGLQGEIGHLPATATIRGEPVVLNCDCEEPGHLSAYASGRGIARMAQVLQTRQPQDWADSDLGRRLAAGEPLEDAFKSAVVAQDNIAATLLDAVVAPIADILRTTLCLAPDLDRIILTGGVAVALGQHYQAAILSRLNRQGIYLTSKYHPQWLADRISIFDADCLIGAGIAAMREIDQ